MAHSHNRTQGSYKVRIAEQWQDEDGYWIALKPGWQDAFNPTCHTIREDSKTQAYCVLKASIACDCLDCKVSLGSDVKD